MPVCVGPCLPAAASLAEAAVEEKVAVMVAGAVAVIVASAFALEVVAGVFVLEVVATATAC